MSVSSSAVRYVGDLKCCECGGDIGLDKVDNVEAFTSKGERLMFVLRQIWCSRCDAEYGQYLSPYPGVIERMDLVKMPRAPVVAALKERLRKRLKEN